MGEGHNSMMLYKSMSTKSPKEILNMDSEDWWKFWENFPKCLDIEVVKHIEKGSWAEIKLVKDKRSGSLYALKVIDLERASDLHLEKESKIHYLADHPHIIKLFQCQMEKDKSRCLLLMEYAPGGDLFKKIEDSNEPLPEDLAAKYLFQVADAIRYLHGMGIVHLDIKPDNILIMGDGTAKLTDFGLSTDKVMCSQRCGTVNYMSPEMANFKPYDKSTDMWSFAVTMAAIITGYDIFISMDKPEDDHATMKNIIAGKYYLGRNLSTEAIDLIESLLAMDPKRRPTIEEVMRHPWFMKHGLYSM